ncbi:MAG: hypothetical protein GQ574_04805 [Crocinitomix sp.]|nr:hypothetical protein [Crocinitomix sp.]
MLKYIPLLLVPIIFACDGESAAEVSNETTETSCIQPPLEGDFVNDVTFKIDPLVENNLETMNGSNFTIPANALVDAAGEPVTEEVEITFNQYHSIPDIITSGIPMSYDTLGESYTFESAGMFSLDGTCNDAPVFVKDGAAIAMNLASDLGEDEPFNFYELDENQGDWTYEHSDSPIANNPRFEREKYIPLKPEPVSEDAFVLDIDFDLSNYDELKVFSGIVWEYTGTDDSLDPRKNAIVSKNRWTDFDLEPTNERAYEYYMTMKNKTRSFTTKCTAALDGEDLDLAMAEFEIKKTEVAKNMEKIQKPFIRSVKISGFGTYNYDYIHRVAEPAELMADFDFGSSNGDKDGALVVLVYPDDNYVVNYPKSQWGSFGIDTEAHSKLIAILPGNQIAVCKEDLSDCFGKEKHTFKMQVLDEKIEDKNALIDVLATL